MGQLKNEEEKLFDESETIKNSSNEEKIIIHPSTELIPDEYEHKSNEGVVVHLFYAHDEYDQKNAKEIFFTLKDSGYNMEKENVHDLYNSEEATKNTDLSKVLKSIAKDFDKNNTGLILFFSANFEKHNSFIATENDQMVHYNPQKVWSFFTADKCPMLRNKPKIFIFQMSPKIKDVETDAVPFTLSYYDTPAEADILIVYNKTNDTTPEYRTKFVNDLCNLIKLHGKAEDLLTLVTCTSQKEHKRPLIISTLTKRFFVCSSEERGHHFKLTEDAQSLLKISEILHERLQDPTLYFFSPKQSFKNFASMTYSKLWSPSSSENKTILDDNKEVEEDIFSKEYLNLQDNLIEADGMVLNKKEKTKISLNLQKDCKEKAEKSNIKKSGGKSTSPKILNKKVHYVMQEVDKIRNIFLIMIALIILFLGVLVMQI